MASVKRVVQDINAFKNIRGGNKQNYKKCEM